MVVSANADGLALASPQEMRERSLVSIFLLAACGGEASDQLAANLEACVADDIDAAAVCGGSQAITAAASQATATVIDASVTYAIAGPGPGKRGYVVFTPSVSGTYTLYSSDDPMRVCDIEPLCRSTELSCPTLDRAARYDMVAGLPYVIELRPQATTAWLHVAAPSTSGGLPFAPVQYYAAGTTPYELSLGDLDGDQILDAVVSTPDDASGMTTVDLMRGDGAGGLSLVDQIATSAPAETVIADFNRDGIADITGIAADGQGPLAGFYLVGQGNFAYDQRVGPTGFDFQSHLSAGDFDEDGTPELVASYAGGATGGGFVILDVPAFTPVQDDPAFGADTGQAVAGDFDGDGHQDVAVANRSAGLLRIYRGDGSGRVAFAFEHPLPGPGITDLGAFDLDGDGRTDLVSIHVDSSIIVTYGGFAASQALVPSVLALDVAAGDLDGDGRVDLAIGGLNDDGGAVAVYFGSAGGFELAGTLSVSGTVRAVAIGDLDGDGRADLAATTPGAIAVFLSR